MKNLIALETSTQACSVAIAKAGEIVATRFVIDRQAHSQQLLGMIQSALTEASLSMTEMEAVVCSIGPGTFTGVRIGVGVAKGLAYGQDIPILSVSSLMATALTAYDESASSVDDLLVINDARMRELYWARYRMVAGKVTADTEQLSTLDALPIAEVATLVGTGINEYQADLSEHQSKFTRTTSGELIEYPQAKSLLQGILDKRIDGTLTTAEALRPNYLRNKVV